MGNEIINFKKFSFDGLANKGDKENMHSLETETNNYHDYPRN